MENRDSVAPLRQYMELSSVIGSLLLDPAIRDIACSAREDLRLALAGLSFGLTRFSVETSLFVRDTLLVPPEFTPCIATAASENVVIVSRLQPNRGVPRDTSELRSYAGCAVLDRQRRCVGVFYLMDTKPRRFSSAAVARLRSYTHLVASQIEIVRRFGVAGRDPSPQEIICRAEAFAGQGEAAEARKLVALAYAAHDIGLLRRSLQGVALQ